MRLDLDNLQTTEKLFYAGVDPTLYKERASSVDVCRCCYNDWEYTDDVDHPPYSDRSIMLYRCAICQAPLSESDN